MKRHHIHGNHINARPAYDLGQLIPAEWMTDAACANHPTPDIWFPHAGHLHADRDRQAKALCNVCPVAAECLTHAIDHNLEGIWGGHTDKERARLRRNQGATK